MSVETTIIDANSLFIDYDDTVGRHGIPHDEIGRLNPLELDQFDTRNIDSLVRLSNAGLPVNIITARGMSTTPLARAIAQSIDSDVANNNKPTIFNIATANGAFAVDVIRMQVITNEVLPDSFFQSLYENPNIANMLRLSTPQERFELNERVIPQEWRDDEVLGKIADFALLYPGFNKLNVELGINEILSNSKVHKMWKETTGVNIQTQQDVRKALNILNKKMGWDVYITGSNSKPTSDITAAHVNKRWSMNQLWEYTKYLYQSYGENIDQELRPISIGDSPDGNDKPMLHTPGGISVTKPESTTNGYPIYYDKGTTTTERTNNLLRLLEAQKGV